MYIVYTHILLPILYIYTCIYYIFAVIVCVQLPPLSTVSIYIFNLYILHFDAMIKHNSDFETVCFYNFGFVVYVDF